MILAYLLKDIWKYKSVERVIAKHIINRLHKTPKHPFKTIGTENAIYHLNKYFVLVEQAITEYNYNDIQPTDIVLDIGACVGGFSLEVYKNVQKVYAVEPLFVGELQDNLELNNADNVKILMYALGDTEEQEVEFVGRKCDVYCKTLTELKEMCGGHVDVLKLDCEGGEWCIEPHELDGIRRIEAEIHSFNGEQINDFIVMLKRLCYDVDVTHRSMKTKVISATKR